MTLKIPEKNGRLEHNLEITKEDLEMIQKVKYLIMRLLVY